MQIKTTMRYHLTHNRVPIIKKKTVGEDMKKLKPLYIVDRDANWCSHYGEQYGGSQKN